MHRKSLSWTGYMQTLKHQAPSLPDVDTSKLESILCYSEHRNSIFGQCVPWVYLLDYTTGKYLLVSESVKVALGFTAAYFRQGGTDLTLEIYNDSHMRLLNQEIFPDRLRILKTLPPEDHAKHIFSYDFTILNNEGQEIHMLQRNCFIRSDDVGNPLMSFGVITNISHYKEEYPVIQLVEKVGDSGRWDDTTVVSKKYYFPDKEHSMLGPRELEVLKWTIEGLTHKAIADRMAITPGTVLLHRKNMLRKTNTCNVAELVYYAVKNHLL